MRRFHRSASSDSAPSVRSLPRTLWLPRTIGLTLGALVVAGALLQQGNVSTGMWLLLLAHALAWPPLAHAVAVRQSDPRRAEHRNLLMDAMLVGLWLPAMGFNLVPTALLVTMTGMNNLAVGGFRLFWRALPLQALSVGVASAALPWTPQLDSNVPTLLACLPFLVVYPLTIAVANHRLARRLAQQKRALERSDQLHRDTLDALEAGVVLYGSDDRLRMCNADFRSLYAPMVHLLRPGIRFQDLLTEVLANDLVPQARGRESEWLAERLAEHREPQSPILREMPGDRWRRIVEKRLPDGSLLAFSTDVTDLVRREQQLRQAMAERDAVEQQLREANRRLSELSETDPLTSLANRRHFDRRLQEEWQRAQRQGSPLSLLALDVDHFKRFNDRHGHPAGDACLQRVAQALQRSARRASDLVARVGGEEFMVLLPYTALDEAIAIAQRCLGEVDEEAIEHDDSPLGPHVTISIGAAQAPKGIGTSTLTDLIAAADAALYRAKKQGRHRVADLPAPTPAPRQMALPMPAPTPTPVL